MDESRVIYEILSMTCHFRVEKRVEFLQYITVYQLPFSHFKRSHADLSICCITFFPLQNGYKKIKKNFE